MPLLPDTAHDLLFRDLAPLDLYNYSKANREACQSITSFRKRAYTLNKYLLPYFTQEQITQFRALRKKLGVLISGSTAIQFFEREEYKDSDLDLYVNYSQGYAVKTFLLKAGYHFRPRSTQEQTFEANADRVARMVHPQVFDFYNAADKKIQLIASKYSPVDAILQFHSTCVMNFITHSHAYSLYARATFAERRSVPSRANGPREVKAREKYNDRGWKTIKVSRDDPAAEFHDILRRVGDKYCWVIPLDHPSDNQGHTEDDDLVGIHTWKMDPFDYYGGPLMTYGFYPHLNGMYCVVEEALSTVISKAPLLLEYGSITYTDAPSWHYGLLRLVKNMFDEGPVPPKNIGKSEDDQAELGVLFQDIKLK
ncbi:hypothetical protein ARMSODRAFT_1024652 [Armillaria solidipes]|uniref:Uncharacterized protein n=1 Tax=Armillaria solidipes TaxID=1076256 RepID=A0A2H3AVC0_9AGAR|nr:hypothetical protein ARMSODRAFT_1024652 [Armillaria solidipes]